MTSYLPSFFSLQTLSYTPPLCLSNSVLLFFFREEAHSFIQLSTVMKEGGMCCLQRERRAGWKRTAQWWGLQAKLPSAHTISTGNTAQLLKNILWTPAFTLPTRGGKEGRAGRLSFIKAIPLTKLQEIWCRVFGISWKPLHLPPDTSVQRTPPKHQFCGCLSPLP